MTLLLNIFDYFILLKYYNTFLGERRRFSRLFFGVASVGLIGLGIAVNNLGERYLNVIVTIFVMIVISFYYKEKIIVKIICISSYYGLGIVTEAITLCLVYSINLRNYMLGEYFVIFLCQLIRLSFIMVICLHKTEQNQNIPRGTTIIIAFILVVGTGGCLLMNWIPINEQRNENLVQTIIVVIVFLLIYFLLFALLNKFNKVERVNYEQSLIIQESLLKDLYYKELDKNNLQLRKISHDLKNQLATLLELTDKDVEAAKITIQNLFDNIKELEGKIYTKNNALNSICNVKFSKAIALNIELEYELDIPENMNISYGDMGIIYGNLLDNALESCEKVDENKRKISLVSKFYNGTLLISLNNSKLFSEKIDMCFKTTKKDKMNHGLGMRSVKDIVDKYSGILEVYDEEDNFRINIILYGIVKL